MGKTILSLCLIALLVATASSATGLSTQEIDALILETDRIKTSNTTQFKANLRQLQDINQSPTASQNEFISYLAIYEQILDGDLETAKERFNQLFDLATEEKVKVRVKATLANIQALSREYENALNNLDYVVTAVEKLDDEDLKNKVHLISAIIYYQLEIFEMSSKYAELLVHDQSSQVLLCKGQVYGYMSKIKENESVTRDAVDQTIGICLQNNEVIYANLLRLEWVNDALDQSIAESDQSRVTVLLDEVKSIENEINDFGYNNLIGLKDVVLAKAYYHNGQTDLALLNAQNAIEGSHRAGNTFQVVDAFRVLKQEALKQENYQQAYTLTSQISQVEREIYSEAKAKQLAYMAVKHSNLARQIEIQQLKQRNALLLLENQLAAETTKRQQLMMLLVISLLMLLGVWAYKIKKRHDYFREVAEIDHLTQVFTRKAFEERMHDLLDQHSGNHQTVNLAIMDLDHFKYVNDEHGHLVGDWVLKQAILTCESAADEDILIARLGGEEFAIVSPGIEPGRMIELMNKLRVAIELMDCADSGAELSVTASFGVSHSGLSGYNISMLLTHADLALFEAKNNGRNRVVSYQTVMAQSPVAKIS